MHAEHTLNKCFCMNTQESFIFVYVETITFQAYSVHHNNTWYSKWMHISRKQMDFRVQNKTHFFCIMHTHTHTHTHYQCSLSAIHYLFLSVN